MLKPKYNNVSESVADYHRLLRGMDQVMPTMGSQREEKPAPKKPEAVQPEPQVLEAVDPAPLSRYQSTKNAMHGFRVLAGLVEGTRYPRDVGVIGSTKSNALIMSEAAGDPARPEGSQMKQSMTKAIDADILARRAENKKKMGAEFHKRYLKALARRGSKSESAEMECQVQESYVGFQKLKAKIAAKGGVRNPGAVAAAVGRNKYGKAKFQKAAASGRKMRGMKAK